LFPNPVVNDLYVDYDGEILTYKVYSIRGELVKTNKFNGKISTSDLHTGLYFIRMSTLNHGEISDVFYKK